MNTNTTRICRSEYAANVSMQRQHFVPMKRNTRAQRKGIVKRTVKELIIASALLLVMFAGPIVKYF